jgi:hypothetical protein
LNVCILGMAPKRKTAQQPPPFKSADWSRSVAIVNMLLRKKKDKVLAMHNIVDQRRILGNKLHELLHSAIKIPLGSPTFWEGFFGNKDRHGRVQKNKLAEGYASSCRQVAVHLLQALECCYMHHKIPYDDINSTYQFYGEAINDRYNKVRATQLCVKTFPYFEYSNEANQEMRHHSNPEPIQLSTLEWITIYCWDICKNPMIYFASIRSIMIDTLPGIQSYMYPSTIHFRSFPKECTEYIVPLLISGKVVHTTLAVGTITIVDNQRKGSLQLYDPMQTSTSGQNLDTVLETNKVGNTRDWVIHPQRMIKGPKQTRLMCVVACSMFCFWKAGALQAKSNWIEAKPTPNDWFDWRYRVLYAVETTHRAFEKEFKEASEDVTLLTYALSRAEAIKKEKERKDKATEKEKKRKCKAIKKEKKRKIKEELNK